MFNIASNKSGEKFLMLGNEAIVRGALESGVQFVTTYPGTPASEIGNTFYEIAKRAGVYFEFSVNEKVALEAAAGAAFSGLKTLVVMKNFGLNVASDFLITLMYSGIQGAMVIVVADDPGCSSSAQSEQNSRFFGDLAHIPILEPSDVQECKDFTKFAFEISEKFKIPIMVRTTTRVALQAGVVETGTIKKSKQKGFFAKNPRNFITMPPRVLEMKKELFQKLEKIRKEVSEKSSLNPLSTAYRGQTSASSVNSLAGRVGIITSGVSCLYVMEALKELNLDIQVLKLGIIYPLPEEKIKNFIKPLKKVLIVEELEPYLEKEVLKIAKNTNCGLQVFGKNLLPSIGELKPEMVIEAIAKLSGKDIKEKNEKLPDFPKRLPQFCTGCPYWLVFGGVKRAVDPKKVIFGGEIGCYMLAGLAPHYIQDYLYCMGSSVSIVHGIKKASPEQKVISFVGDSSFFHAGIPALINAVYNNSDILVIILKNDTTAMTGHQPHPGIEKTREGRVVSNQKIEEIVRACGVKNLKTIDPINQKDFIRTIKNFLNKKGVSVIVAKHRCVFVK